MLKEMYEGKIVPCGRHNCSSAKQLEIVRNVADEEKYFEKQKHAAYQKWQASVTLSSILLLTGAI